MKRVLSIMLCIFLCISVALPAYADDEFLLSEMSESECIEFVKQNNIAIPDDYEDENIWGPFIKQIIEIVEENPYHQFQFNYTVTQAFANSIMWAVNEYYGIAQANTYRTITTDISANVLELEDSTPITPWISDYASYNCYIFSIGIPQKVFVNPGYFSNQNFSIMLTVQGIVDLVCDDLTHLQHSRILVSTEVDLSNLCTNEQIICVRKGTYDYHFMTYDFEGWHHKPGTSAILRYHHIPGVSRIWTNEGLFWDGLRSGDTEYDSDIYYISYNGHDWEFTSNNNGTHSKHCDICGDTITTECNLRYKYVGSNFHQRTCGDCGYTTSTQACTYSYTGNGNGTHERVCTLCGNSMNLPCEMTYEYLMYSQHRAECTLCGDVIAEDCVAVPNYCGNSSTQHIHADACQDCGNVMSSATESCTLEYIFAGTVNGTNTHSRVCTECGYVQTQSAACFYKNSNYCFFCGAHKDTVQAASLDEMDTME